MKHTFHSAVALILTAALLFAGLTGCFSTAPPTATETDEESTTEANDSMTLELPTLQDPPTDEAMPPLMTPDPAADHDALLITSYYATGNVAGDAMVEASYVELYNGADHALPLAGVSLYVSDRGRDYTEYRFSAEDSIPPRGYFLIRGRDANGITPAVLSLQSYDRRFSGLSPDPGNTRLVLAPAGTSLPADKPLAEMDGVFAYVTSHPLDGSDEYHFIDSGSASKVIRKKANTDKVDYQSIHLGKAAHTVLSAIRPKCTKGDVNTVVQTRIDEVIFSHESGVYEEGFDLTLTAPEGYTVYFTINDTDPLVIAATRYTAPLHLTDTTNMTWGRLTTSTVEYLGTSYIPLVPAFPGAAVIKAYAVRESDGACTPLTTHTYFIGKEYASWGVDMVSVSVNSEEFIGRRGIYNTLRTDKDGGHSHIPAYVEFFSPEGTSVHAGWSEIAMNGRGSLGMTQKSFRILLKSNVMNTEDVQENLNTLNYDLYKEYASKTPDGERVTWYRHILLRNGGGDMSGSTISRSHIGDAYIQRLDRILIPDVMAYAPVMTFVNGEFWGLFNARDRMDPKYFEGKYGVSEEDFALLECPYPLTFGWNVDFTTANGDPAEATYFMELVNFCVQNDMSVQANYDYVAERIDLDGLVDQYCAQIYLCCSDWPSNNIKVWRNTNPDHPTMDTKWHFTIVDTDHGVGLNSDIHTNLWGVINDGPVLSRIVGHMLQNPGFRERFLMRYVWCMEVAFAPERMHAELNTLVDTIRPVMQYQLDRFRCTNGERTDWDKWYSYIETIHHFADNRYEPAKAQFMAWAGISDGVYNSLRSRSMTEWGSTVTE